ncbi:MAG: hypothetical protein C0490_16080 [Marivirga sp.]|nr:hypothetical protein [Marivirga sp.]
MKKRIQLFFSCALLTFCLSGCFIPPKGEYATLETEGYRPVYGSQELKEIQLVSAREVKNPGKIYTYKSFLLVNEIQEGIHVYDNVDPHHPKAIGFIQIIGNSDMAVKENVLYADHMGNLVALTIDNFNTITKAGSLPLENWHLGVPPPAGSYFECIDQSKGIVIRWTKAELKNPGCYAIN